VNKVFAKWLVLLFFLLVSVPAGAKRIAAPKVAPVVFRGVRYVAPNRHGDVGYVQAWDIRTGKRLWQVVVYRVPMKPNLEQDVQYRFIIGLNIRGGRLLITNESGQHYALDLRTRRVKKVALP